MDDDDKREPGEGRSKAAEETRDRPVRPRAVDRDARREAPNPDRLANVFPARRIAPVRPIFPRTRRARARANAAAIDAARTRDAPRTPSERREAAIATAPRRRKPLARRRDRVFRARPASARRPRLGRTPRWIRAARRFGSDIFRAIRFSPSRWRIRTGRIAPRRVFFPAIVAGPRVAPNISRRRPIVCDPRARRFRFRSRAVVVPLRSIPSLRSLTLLNPPFLSARIDRPDPVLSRRFARRVGRRLRRRRGRGRGGQGIHPVEQGTRRARERVRVEIEIARRRGARARARPREGAREVPSPRLRGARAAELVADVERGGGGVPEQLQARPAPRGEPV